MRSSLTVARAGTGQLASCPRCGRSLSRPQQSQANTGLALAIAAVVPSVLAMFEPLFVVNVFGNERYYTVFTGVVSLWTSTLRPLGLMVLLSPA